MTPEAIEGWRARARTNPLDFARWMFRARKGAKWELVPHHHLINAFLPGAVSIDAAVGQPGRILVKGHGAPRAPVLPCQRISAVGGFKSGFLPARGASG